MPADYERALLLQRGRFARHNNIRIQQGKKPITLEAFKRRPAEMAAIARHKPKK